VFRSFNGDAMAKSHGAGVSFHQGCPVCGRLLNIGVTLLGRRVYCQHCGGGFVAADSSCGRAGQRSQDRHIDDLLERADAALQEAADAGEPHQTW
jgi:hypothetical protein